VKLDSALGTSQTNFWTVLGHLTHFEFKRQCQLSSGGEMTYCAIIWLACVAVVLDLLERAPLIEDMDEP
jgi:hypothetical protein